MKQVLYDMKGKVFVEDVPVPSCGRDQVLVRNEFSLISAGTEKSMISLMKKPLYQMALERKDLARQVLRFAKESGIKKTMELVKSRLDVWHQLGYSSAGVVVKAGDLVKHLGVGDRVSVAGAGYANHADYVIAPHNMIVKIPKDVKSEEAAFAGIGAIALQSVRQLEPTIGETHVVLGLGLIGQLVSQILKANGCTVIGIDQDGGKTKRDYIDHGLTAASAEDVLRCTKGRGADGVIVAASSKADLVNDAFDMCRKRGRVVLLGVTGLNIDRSRMYEKELDFRISTSFGPGYYDPAYEHKSVDYPLAFVRWTANRNMEAFISLIAKKQIDVSTLVEETFDVDKAEAAYERIIAGQASVILIRYSPAEEHDKDTIVEIGKHSEGKIRIGLIGVGNFAKGFLIPSIGRTKMKIHAVCAINGSGAKKVATELGSRYATTDYHKILKDKDIDLVMISTRHDSHARIAMEAIKAGKHVYVEKPAAIEEDECDRLEEAQKKHRKIFAVGFNRRYSPAMIAIKERLKQGVPIIVNYVFNNTYLAQDHWVNDREIGGGRFIGEGCHIIDLFGYLTGSAPSLISGHKLTSTEGKEDDENSIVATVKYKDGSVCNLVYSCLGNSASSRERCTVIQDGAVFEMDNFSETKLNGRRIWSGNSDMGYDGEMHALSDKLEGKDSSLITGKDSMLATKTTIALMRCVKGK
jgi:predicted dehydrogenase/threonine dehydrogenase-like Zn-dependent dehydrogenase